LDVVDLEPVLAGVAGVDVTPGSLLGEDGITKLGREAALGAAQVEDLVVRSEHEPTQGGDADGGEADVGVDRCAVDELAAPIGAVAIEVDLDPRKRILCDLGRHDHMTQRARRCSAAGMGGAKGDELDQGVVAALRVGAFEVGCGGVRSVGGSCRHPVGGQEPLAVLGKRSVKGCAAQHVRVTVDAPGAVSEAA
jgi:hypothetical protein